MKKTDLHVHSKFSEHPSEWFLQRIGASESYTEPDFIYETALQNGMSFITLTDHNCIKGSLYLKEKYPEQVFTGVESTAYFPEDRCKIHILIYGLTEGDFQEVQKRRKDIYELRDFLRERNLAHSIAHATYSVNNRLTLQHLEKLILLFDVFEGINGARSKASNMTWMHVLQNLSPAHIEDLYRTYKIEPFSSDPWVKGFTGGSDDHGGIFIGKTYTCSEENNIVSFLESLKNKKTCAAGRHNNYQSLAFSIYKVAYDFSRNKSGVLAKSLLRQITENVFEEKKFSLSDRLKMKKLKTLNGIKEDTVNNNIIELIEELRKGKGQSVEVKFQLVYEKIANISDGFFSILLSSLEQDLKKGDIENILKNITSSISGIFLALPFFSTLKHLTQGRVILDTLIKKFGKKDFPERKKILWFTDTLNDLNGISATLIKMGWTAYFAHEDMRIVTSLAEDDVNGNLPPNILNLPVIHEFQLPYYEQYVLKVPSLLKSIKLLYDYEPTEVYISTPGTVGLLGLLTAKLLNIKCTGVFHTDFSLQASEIIDDESIVQMIEDSLRYFYSLMDEINVPTEKYQDILEQRGYDRNKMSLFRRGIDQDLFYPEKNGREYIRKRFGIQDGPVLLYVGRISKDKNLKFLFDVYSRIAEKRKGVNLLIVGDGPYLLELKDKAKEIKRIYFAHQLDRKLLPGIYSGADFFVFPSITDTFGMVVFEAQACGLPAIVSDAGGPQELVEHARTGYIVRADSEVEWQKAIENGLDLITDSPEQYKRMRAMARERVSSRHNWQNIVQTIFRASKLYKKDVVIEEKPSDKVYHELTI
ncbi:MAG: glycosyltransferase [Candidatus Aureabacteria bacterium]|nr:glycosyltransferase [Candidatus Auribacterota bacterium]